MPHESTTAQASIAAPKSALRALADYVRARRLYRWGQGVAANGGADASHRAARLYRRALRVLGAASAPAPTPETSATDTAERLAVREQLRAELAQRGLRGLLLHRPRVVYASAVILGLVLLLPTAASWLEPDLAAGKVWTASSNWGPFPITGVMAGDVLPEGRFHTNEEVSPWVVVDLGKVTEVHAVSVENRVNCCRERAVPLSVELSVDNQTFWRVAYRRALFERFTARFAPHKARYVRLRVDRRSTLHLRQIAVY